MNKIRREQRIHLQPVFNNTFNVLDKEGKTLIGFDEQYFIYFKQVNFKPNGIIEGTYQGENPSTIIDEYCKSVEYTDEGWKMEGRNKPVKTARLVAVNNKTGAIIIIEST